MSGPKELPLGFGGLGLYVSGLGLLISISTSGFLTLNIV